MKKIMAGDDIEIEITLLDENSGVINLTPLLDITVDICEGSCLSNDVLSFGYSDLTVKDAAGGVFVFVLPRDWTIDNEGRVFNIEVTAVFNRMGNPVFAQNEQHVSVILKNALKIVSQC